MVSNTRLATSGVSRGHVPHGVPSAASRRRTATIFCTPSPSPTVRVSWSSIHFSTVVIGANVAERPAPGRPQPPPPGLSPPAAPAWPPPPGPPPPPSSPARGPASRPGSPRGADAAACPLATLQASGRCCRTRTTARGRSRGNAPSASALPPSRRRRPPPTTRPVVSRGARSPAPPRDSSSREPSARTHQSGARRSNRCPDPAPSTPVLPEHAARTVDDLAPSGQPGPDRSACRGDPQYAHSFDHLEVHRIGVSEQAAPTDAVAGGQLSEPADCGPSLGALRVPLRVQVPGRPIGVTGRPLPIYPVPPLETRHTVDVD